MIDYVKPLDHIIPRPITLVVNKKTTSIDLEIFIKEIEKKYPKHQYQIRCKRAITAGALRQHLFEIKEFKINKLKNFKGVCQVSLDPHDVFSIEALISKKGEILDVQINRVRDSI